MPTTVSPRRRRLCAVCTPMKPAAVFTRRAAQRERAPYPGVELKADGYTQLGRQCEVVSQLREAASDQLDRLGG